MDKISDQAKYEITHITFKDSVSTVKIKMLELENIMSKMGETDPSITTYEIENPDGLHSNFSFNHVDHGRLEKLDSIKPFLNLSLNETRQFIKLIKFLNNNGLNGTTLDRGALYFNYHDFITQPTNWTERKLLLKRKNESTKNWIDISPVIDDKYGFVLLDEP